MTDHQSCSADSRDVTELARRHAARWGDHSPSTVAMLEAFGQRLMRDAAQSALRCPACSSANVTRNPNGWFDCHYCNKMGSAEEFAAQPPAAPVDDRCHCPDDVCEHFADGSCRKAHSPCSAGNADADELSVANADREVMRKAMVEACDLLAERKYGNPARSPGHNARLVLERALSTGIPDGPQGAVHTPLGLESMLGRPYGQEKSDVACLSKQSCGWPTCECGRHP